MFFQKWRVFIKYLLEIFLFRWITVLFALFGRNPGGNLNFLCNQWLESKLIFLVFIIRKTAKQISQDDYITIE